MTRSFAKRIDPRFAELLRGTSGAVGMRVCAASLTILTGILLARMLGAEGLGIFVYTQALVAFLGTLAGLGFSQLLVREVAIHRGQGNWAAIRGILRYTLRLGLSSAAAIGICAAFAALWLLPGDEEAVRRLTLLVALIGLPVAVWSLLQQAATRGLNRVTAGLLPEMLARPLIFIVLLIAIYAMPSIAITPPKAMILFVVALVLSMLLGNYILRRTLLAETKWAATGGEIRNWLKLAVPLYIIGLVQFINHQADTLMLGYLSAPEEVGVYAVARGLTEAIAFVLVAAGIFIAPSIARLYSLGEIETLQYVVRKASQLVLAAAVPVAIGLIVFKDWLLALYGPEFASAGTPLLLLCAGQFIGALCGPIGQLAIHTGHDKATTVVVGIAATVNISLNFLLIPVYGAVGAAAATAVALAIWNIGLLWYIRMKTGLSALPFAFSAKAQSA